MFTHTFVEARTGTKWTVTVSFAAQIATLGILLLIPLIYTQRIGSASLHEVLMLPSAPLGPRPTIDTSPKTRTHIRPLPGICILCAPTKIPQHVLEIVDAPEVTAEGSIELGSVAVPRIELPAITAGPPPPPPPPVKPVERAREPIKVGGKVQEANLIRRVLPSYPMPARMARIQGTVRFTATIGKDGAIQNLQLISGPPLLVQAAQDAVRQWLYRPTLLNGEPVEVLTQIDVNFALNP